MDQKQLNIHLRAVQTLKMCFKLLITVHTHFSLLKKANINRVV